MEDIETLMEFRQMNWKMWCDFVADNDDYCPKCYLHNTQCDCENIEVD